jgi:predicted GNAT family acetyltransferase
VLQRVKRGQLEAVHVTRGRQKGLRIKVIAQLGDRQLHDFVVFNHRAVVATAQIVTTDYKVAYVSRMFTAPEHRQKAAAAPCSIQCTPKRAPSG